VLPRLLSVVRLCTQQRDELYRCWALLGAWHPPWHPVKGVGKQPGLRPLTHSRPPRLARELSNPPLQRQMEPSEKIASNGEQEPGWAGLGGGLCWPDVNSSLITPNWPNLFTDTWGDQLHLSPTEQASLPPAWKHFCSRDGAGQLTTGRGPRGEDKAKLTPPPSLWDPRADLSKPPLCLRQPLSPSAEVHTV
jgi:hypothetical protein